MAKILKFTSKNDQIVNKINDLALELKVNLIKSIALKNEILKLRDKLNGNKQTKSGENKKTD